VRLERNERGEKIYRANSASVRREERYRESRLECVFKDTADCDQNCDYCARSYTSHTVEMDMHWNKDGEELVSLFELDEDIDIHESAERNAELEAFNVALEKLPYGRELWELLKAGASKKAIAGHFGITVNGVRYREQRMHEIFCADEPLKNFFRK
jgi:hypothetical protein